MIDTFIQDKEPLWNFLNDMVSEMEVNGIAGSYIMDVFEAVKSSLSFIGVEV
jgi:hypothetical protein